MAASPVTLSLYLRYKVIVCTLANLPTITLLRFWFLFTGVRYLLQAPLGISCRKVLLPFSYVAIFFELGKCGASVVGLNHV